MPIHLWLCLLSRKYTNKRKIVANKGNIRPKKGVALYAVTFLLHTPILLLKCFFRGGCIGDSTNENCEPYTSHGHTSVVSATANKMLTNF